MTPQAYPANAFAVKLNDRGVKARVKLPCNMSSNRLGEETKHLNVSSDKECRQLGVAASNSCGYSSAVELLPSKQVVVSSNLIARSKYRKRVCSREQQTRNPATAMSIPIKIAC